MIQRITSLLIAPMLALCVTSNSSATTIEYTASNIAGTTWQYDYNVINDSLGGDIQEFTIYFSQSQYANLDLGITPANWSPVFWQPGSIAGLNDGGYDALALASGITPSSSLAGFSIRFDWLGTDAPGSQPFEIIDPQNISQVMDAGSTSLAKTVVPVPAAIWLFSSGLIALAGISRRHYR